MDELAIWNATLSAEEVAAIFGEGTPTELNVDQGAYQSASSLLAWWRMGDSSDGQGASVLNVAADGSHGTLVGAATLVEEAP